ncbi:MAG: glycoside hydrolase family 28 protein [Bacteroidales bacterium]
MRIFFIKIVFQKPVYLLLLLAFGCGQIPLENPDDHGIYDGIEFEMPEVMEPVFPDYSVSVTDFGARGDGQTLNTGAFSDAIAMVAEKGGGHVIIPRGIWLTGPIVLKSNIDMHAEAGALVIFSKNKDLYPLTVSNWEGWKTVRCQSPISGKDLENIAITGEGVFDGSGEAWRLVKRDKMTDAQWKELINSGGIVSENGKEWYPSESFKRGEDAREKLGPWFSDNLEDYEDTKDFYRPVMVSLQNCNKILLDGPVFQNSPAWCIHPLMCENLTVRNIDVRNPWYSQNGDGIDIESCKNSVVYNCTFDVGDDAICIKSGKDQEGRDRGMATENLVVKNCVVYHGHGGVTVGSEMSGGVKNMHVSNCTFIGTDVGLRFKSNRGRGGVVEKIYISNIEMVHIPTNAISFNLYYGGLSPAEMIAQSDRGQKNSEIHEVNEETPVFRDISMKNIRCKGALQAIYLQGLPEMNLENIQMENMVMESEKGLLCMDARGITIRGLNLICTDYPAITLYNAKDVFIEDLEWSDPVQQGIIVKGDESENIRVDGEPVK